MTTMTLRSCLREGAAAACAVLLLGLLMSPNRALASVASDNALPQPMQDTSKHQPPAGPGTTSSAPAPATTPPPAVLPRLDSVRVQWVALFNNQKRTTSDTVIRAGIGDLIVLKVDHLIDLVNISKCLAADGRTVANCREKKIALYLAGREIKNLFPESGAPLPAQQTVQFHLQRGAESDEAWADLLGSPHFGEGFNYRPTEISVGLEGEYALPSDVTNASERRFDLIRAKKGWVWFASGLTVLLIGLLWWLGIDSDLLRDVGPEPVTGTNPPKRFLHSLRSKRYALKTYSLGKCQMAFWFTLVIVSFTFIWLITGASDINGTVLALMGIGTGTALGSAVIEAGKQQSTTADTVDKLTALSKEEAQLRADVAAVAAQIAAPPATPADLERLQTQQKTREMRLQEVLAEQAKLTALRTEEAQLRADVQTLTVQIAAPPATPADLARLDAERKAKETRLREVAAERAKLGARATARVSEGFINDLLADETGISFHRFQMATWTLVLGILFIVSVWKRLSMPEFNLTLLAMLGISVGTYLGFKIPEKQ